MSDQRFRAEESFTLRLTWAMLPMLWWLAVFFAGYAFVAAGCSAGLHTHLLASVSYLRWGLILLVLLLMAGLAAMAWITNLPPEDELARSVRLLSVLVALVATVWLLVPVLTLPLCRIA
ncbi:MAG: hypothetical protein REI94_03220 [Moraxellaceae bacterium]|nr:hypothetical protein [Moraxellaceae bacterium]